MPVKKGMKNLNIAKLLRPDEQVTLALRSLYEQYGYKKYRMSKFEEYDFYTKNKDFLSSQEIITFTDLDGKLMALKPDVTLSIVKNTRADEACEKLYYTENVYRAARGRREYKEIFQIGLEFIGRVTPYINVETVNLALKSLALIKEDYVLDVSHMGFLTGLLDSLAVDDTVKMEILDCLVEKNNHELQKIVANQSLTEEEGRWLAALVGLSGPLPETLAKARALTAEVAAGIPPQIGTGGQAEALARGSLGQAAAKAEAKDRALAAMLAALAELECLSGALAVLPEAKNLRLDFSISSDAKYYNGLMLRGYVAGVPRAVLSGGRYDPLLRRLGKKRLEAIGFAIYFDELERYLKSPAEEIKDLVVLYDEKSSLTMLTRTVEEAVSRGLTVRATDHLPKGLQARRLVKINGERAEEAAND